ncbi:LamG domain-containing protein [Luteolibacter pohnpeiensis]|uniref:LamG domain-containing protein n=1 Tax=Luteolibacter pohnpeiensis TaxID=454153 RepID=A0A934VW99_9BACT|nr:LamG domain-containing protein [Luteolibacter pohnpeiensis]MBK1882274.1 LamG domain-containing protein [Luteolibacter pohnpeiensis]
MHSSKTHTNRLPGTAVAMFGLMMSSGPALAAGYESSVLADEPLFYLPLGVVPPTESVAPNRGTAEVLAPDGVHQSVLYGFTGALPGTSSNTAVYYESAARTVVPYSAALNPAASESFTIEFWVEKLVNDSPTDASPVFNREEADGGNYQGWAFFQGADNAGNIEFKMYDGTSSSPTATLSSGTNLFFWNHITVTWQADTQTATLYVNGTQMDTATGVSYKAVESSAFSLGGAPDGSSNTFAGALDEIAFYPEALSATDISSHYTIGSSEAPTESYPEKVEESGPALYLRQSGYSPTRSIANNLGSVGSDANGVHFPGLEHQVAGALAGSEDTAAGYHLISKTSSDGSYPTVLPFREELNTSVFSVEAWIRPTITGNSNAQCPLYNYNPSDGVRSGWVIWQRSPSTGWNFRCYNDLASGTKTAIDVEFGPYVIGEWQHVVVTFDGSKAICYLNGQQVATKNVNGTYNPNTIADSTLIQASIGGFPNGWENGFEGDVDEVGYYDKVLTAAQVEAHYANGVDANRSVPYEDLILSDGPVGYYRLDEAAVSVQDNLGTLGTAANATVVNAPATTPAPSNGGFASGDYGNVFDGYYTYVEMNNPTGLNFTGPITLEAWVQPASEQVNYSNNIIGHGLAQDGSEVFLRIENGEYQVGANGGKAVYTVPEEDLTGDAWVHLAGTWDGSKWTLYRNGVNVAEAEDATGPGLVDTANWAVGARGRWQTATGYPDVPDSAARIFSGGILGAAIFNKALTEEQIDAHYAAVLADMNIQITRPDGVITLTWEGGVLQESDNLVDWQDVTVDGNAAVSPYQPNDGPRHFYRVREAD